MNDEGHREQLTYKSAGVDIDRAADVVDKIGAHVQRTLRPGVLGDIGGFGGLFAVDTERYTEPVLVAGTDGVGTKLQLAFQLDKHDTIGQDCVAMCVNDIIVQGAEPLFFLDYIASERLDPHVIEQLVQGVADGCQMAGCALLGGETAEMPGSYPEGEYDIAGFAVGVVNKPDIIDGSTVRTGDVVIGLASSGVHSNGYSLVRHILSRGGHGLNDKPVELGGATLGETLLTPTRIYAKTVLKLKQQGFKLKAMAHITGGGLTDNIPRCLPSGLSARLNTARWRRPPIFDLLQSWGNVAVDEMRRTFNDGIGFVLIVPEAEADAIVQAAEALGESATVIGAVVPGADDSTTGEVLYT